MEILTKLGIDWQQIVAQLINFGVLAGILTLLLYRPLIRAIDDRRARIAKSIKDAEQVENKMKEIERLQHERLKKTDQEAGVLLERAKKDAEAVKAQILSSASHDAEVMKQKAAEHIAVERRKVYEDAQKHLTSMVIKMTQKILGREFTPADQDRLLKDLEKEVSTLRI